MKWLHEFMGPYEREQSHGTTGIPTFPGSAHEQPTAAARGTPYVNHANIPQTRSVDFVDLVDLVDKGRL